MDKIQDILNDHKKAAILTGKLSDFQLNNLKTYPFILFDKIIEVQIEYDIKLKEKGISTVTYLIKSNQPTSDVEFIDDKVLTLTTWVQSVLWDTVMVSVLYNNQSIKIDKVIKDINETAN
jgi:hypothetical protein